MTQLLVIAHAPLASALQEVAKHTFPDCAPTLSVLDVAPGMCPDDVEAAARALMQQVAPSPAAEWLVLVDTPHATPHNGAVRLASAQVQVLTGLSVPMLWRTLCYAGQSHLTDLARRASQGAANGIIATPALPPDT